MKTDTARDVFAMTPAVWEHAHAAGEIVTGPKWMGDWKQAAQTAGVETHNQTSWVVRVEQVAARHTAIRVGDYLCREREKGPVYVVRLPASETP